MVIASTYAVFPVSATSEDISLASKPGERGRIVSVEYYPARCVFKITLDVIEDSLNVPNCAMASMTVGIQ